MKKFIAIFLGALLLIIQALPAAAMQPVITYYPPIPAVMPMLLSDAEIAIESSRLNFTYLGGTGPEERLESEYTLKNMSHEPQTALVAVPYYEHAYDYYYGVDISLDGAQPDSSLRAAVLTGGLFDGFNMRVPGFDVDRALSLEERARHYQSISIAEQLDVLKLSRYLPQSFDAEKECKGYRFNAVPKSETDVYAHIKLSYNPDVTKLLIFANRNASFNSDETEESITLSGVDGQPAECIIIILGEDTLKYQLLWQHANGLVTGSDDYSYSEKAIEMPPEKLVYYAVESTQSYNTASFGKDGMKNYYMQLIDMAFSDGKSAVEMSGCLNEARYFYTLFAKVIEIPFKPEESRVLKIDEPISFGFDEQSKRRVFYVLMTEPQETWAGTGTTDISWTANRKPYIYGVTGQAGARKLHSDSPPDGNIFIDIKSSYRAPGGLPFWIWILLLVRFTWPVLLILLLIAFGIWYRRRKEKSED